MASVPIPKFASLCCSLVCERRNSPLFPAQIGSPPGLVSTLGPASWPDQGGRGPFRHCPPAERSILGDVTGGAGLTPFFLSLYRSADPQTAAGSKHRVGACSAIS